MSKMIDVYDISDIFDVFNDDIVDSRDVQSILDDIDSELDSYREIIDKLDNEEELTEDEQEEIKGVDIDDLRVLRDIEEEINDIKSECADSGWNDGIDFIRENHWVEYCQQWAEDVGYIGDMQNNPLYHHIDWESWADDMEQDYQTIEIGGETYYWREA